MDVLEGWETQFLQQGEHGLDLVSRLREKYFGIHLVLRDRQNPYFVIADVRTNTTGSALTLVALPSLPKLEIGAPIEDEYTFAYTTESVLLIFDAARRSPYNGLVGFNTDTVLRDFKLHNE
mmetsp:Transcript_3613/g.11887  ORF Transcript_3613/g.11887 Transcript_3613/m.11887 type:complete len:121 (+) Transcript_3613:1849-2211(+)